MKKNYADRYTEAYLLPSRKKDPVTGRIYYEKRRLADGSLYTDGKYRRATKIKPEDLPEWYLKVWQAPYVGHDYISAKDVTELAYWHPNKKFDNHSFRDFHLMIGYRDEPINPDDMYTYQSLWGWDAVKFVSWVEKYSPEFDITVIKKAMIEKYNAYVKYVTRERKDFGLPQTGEGPVKKWEELVKRT